MWVPFHRSCPSHVSCISCEANDCLVIVAFPLVKDLRLPLLKSKATLSFSSQYVIFQLCLHADLWKCGKLSPPIITFMKQLHVITSRSDWWCILWNETSIVRGNGMDDKEAKWRLVPHQRERKAERMARAEYYTTVQFFLIHDKSEKRTWLNGGG